MHGGETILFEIIVILAVSVMVVLLFQRLKVPSIIGFMIAGILVGPHGLALVNNVENVEMLAEVGVIMLLFIIGLEFSLASLVRIRKFVLLGGSLQVLITIGIIYLLGRVAGMSMSESVFLGFLISLSSTALVLKLYQKRGEIDSLQGKTILAILIFQDIIVVPMMLVTPLLSGNAADISIDWSVFLFKGGGIIIATYLAARYFIPWLLKLVVHSANKELFILAIVGICFAVAYFTSSLGLSLALGAFLAGLIISESEYAHQAISNISPFYEIFTSFFFVSMGMLLQVTFLVDNLMVVLLLAIGIIILKSVAGIIASLTLRLPARLAVVCGMSLGQVGEFAFVLAVSGASYGLISEINYQYFLSVSILTMAATPALIWSSSRLGALMQAVPLPARLRRAFGKQESFDFALSENKNILKDHLIIIGYGLNGRNLAKAAQYAGIEYVIIELNADTVSLEKRKEHIIYGDAVQPGVLEHVNVADAKAVVIAISDPVSTRRIISNARNLSPDTFIIARTRYVYEVKDLLALGADDVIPEEYETSIELFARVLRKYLVPRNEIEKLITEIRSDGYDMLRSTTVKATSFIDGHNEITNLELEAHRITDKSPLNGKTLSELDLRKKFGITIISVKEAEKVITNPGPDLVLNVGKVVYVIGTTEDLNRFSAFVGRK